jgi:hypothetical protein
MSETHYKKLINPDYLGAYSLEPGQDMILTIKSVGKEMITGTGGKQEECIVCRWVEDQKPMILNVTNCKTISKMLKTPYVEKWAGHRIQIYATTTKFGGDTVECLRIRKDPPEEKQIACEECGQFIQPAFSMSVTQLAAYTKKKYGKNLCAECAQAKKEAAAGD